MTIPRAAAELDVDASTVWWWGMGRPVHRLKDRQRLEHFIESDQPENSAEAPPENYQNPSGDLLGLARTLRARRRELNLTQSEAAALIDVSPWTLLGWEHDRHTPPARYFPSLMRFLDAEPWPPPVTLAEKLLAERLRRGLTRQQMAAVLQVDAMSIAAWEAGRGPHHKFAKRKVDAVLTGSARPTRMKAQRNKR